MDDENDIALLSQTDAEIHSLRLMSFRRKTEEMCRILGYAEVVIPQMLQEDFRTHFRISKPMFQDILAVIEVDLSRNHGGGVPIISPSKQLLVYLCYMSNQESMREVGHWNWKINCSCCFQQSLQSHH